MADADGFFNELEDQCTCWVCFEVFKEPITLLCLHSFCKECTVKVYKKDAQCPFCRRPFNLPLPPVNKTLEVIVEGFLTRQRQIENGGVVPQPQPDVNMNPAPVLQEAGGVLELPYDVLVDIFTMCSADDVAHAAQSCAPFNKAAQNGWIWRTFAKQTSPFCNVDKYNKNWKLCYVGLRKRQVGWNGGKSGDFEVITMRGHTNYITRFILSNNKIYSASADNTVKIWNIHKNEAIATLGGHRASVESIQTDNVKVLSGGRDGEVRAWDISSGICTSEYSHGGSVDAVLFDQAQVYSAGSDARLKVWDVRSGQEVHNFGGHLRGISDIKKDDQGRIVTLSQDALKVWDLRAAPTDHRIFLGPAPVHHHDVFAAPGGNCFQISRNKLVVGGQDGRVHVYTPSTGANQTIPSQHIGAINCLQCDGSKVVTGGADNTLKVWDLDRNVLLRTLEDHKGPVHSVQFDDSKIVSCSADNTVKVWKMETGQRLYSLLGGSLQARANNPPHPLRPGSSGMVYDESSVIASFNSLIRVYSFEPTPPQPQ